MREHKKTRASVRLLARVAPPRASPSTRSIRILSSLNVTSHDSTLTHSTLPKINHATSRIRGASSSTAPARASHARASARPRARIADAPCPPTRASALLSRRAPRPRRTGTRAPPDRVPRLARARPSSPRCRISRSILASTAKTSVEAISTLASFSTTRRRRARWRTMGSPTRRLGSSRR